jgi:hypothetical protein
MQKACETMPQRTAADTGAREDLKAAEMSVNHHTHMRVADRPETDYVCRAEDHSIESTPSVTATELAPEPVCRRFNCDTLSYLS